MDPDARSPADAELAIFDIDGPVTDPRSRKIEDPEILDQMLAFTTGGGYVAYNTGRANAIAHRRVISPLLDRAGELGIDVGTIRRRVAVFAEKGAVTSIWDSGSGRWSDRIDPATIVPADLAGEVVSMLRSDPEYRAYIFFDDAKETMVSVEMRYETPGPVPVPITPEMFKPIAARFTGEVRRLAMNHGYDDIEVDHTTIAVDVQRRGVGKDLGTRLAFDWLDSLGQRVERVHCFGDSKSDVAMAAEAHAIMNRSFADAGKRVVYVHVGEKIPIEGDFIVRSFPGGYWRGTIAYLRSLSGAVAEGSEQRAALAVMRNGYGGEPASMTP